MELRRYRPGDLQEIVNLFYDTVNSVNSGDYSKEQIKAWSGSRDLLLKKNDFFMSLYTILAVKDEVIIGYGNIDDFGYLDHLYVHKDYQGLKTATALCDELEQHSLLQNLTVITVNASITARPFFEKRGYITLREQLAEAGGVKMKNYSMKKELLQQDSFT